MNKENKEEIKIEIMKLIKWAYKASFPNVFDYKNGKTILNEKSKEKIDKIINKFLK